MQVLEGLAEVEPREGISEVLTLVYTINTTRLQGVTIECKIRAYRVKEENLGNKMTSYINRVKRKEIRAEERALPGMVVYAWNHSPEKAGLIKIKGIQRQSQIHSKLEASLISMRPINTLLASV